METIPFRAVVETHGVRLIEFLKLAGVNPTDRDVAMLREAAKITDIADRTIGGCWRICEWNSPAPRGHTKYPDPKVSGRFLFSEVLPPQRPAYQRNPEYTWAHRKFDEEVGAVTTFGNGQYSHLGEFTFFPGGTYTSPAPTFVFTTYADKLAVQFFVDRDPARGQRVMYGANADDLFGQAVAGVEQTPHP